MNILHTLTEIVTDILDEEDLTVTEATSPEDSDEWDSMAQIQIIEAIENEFSTKFSLQEIEQLNQLVTVGDTARFVEHKLAHN